MCFLIEHDDLFGNHDTIMDKVSVGIKKKLMVSLFTVKHFSK